MGWGPESRILLNTSSKKTFRSLLGATGRFPVRPESGDSAQYFFKKKPSGRLSSRRKVAISLGTSANRLWYMYQECNSRLSVAHIRPQSSPQVTRSQLQGWPHIDLIDPDFLIQEVVTKKMKVFLGIGAR